MLSHSCAGCHYFAHSQKKYKAAVSLFKAYCLLQNVALLQLCLYSNKAIEYTLSKGVKQDVSELVSGQVVYQESIGSPLYAVWGYWMSFAYCDIMIMS